MIFAEKRQDQSNPLQSHARLLKLSSKEYVCPLFYLRWKRTFTKNAYGGVQVLDIPDSCRNLRSQIILCHPNIFVPVCFLCIPEAYLDFSYIDFYFITEVHVI